MKQEFRDVSNSVEVICSSADSKGIKRSRQKRTAVGRYWFVQNSVVKARAQEQQGCC